MDEVKVLFEEAFGSGNYAMLAVGVIIAIIFWLLPVMLAVLFNRKYLKVIAVASVPAFFSFVLWFSLLVFAVTGRGVEKFIKKQTAATDK
ncbi:hypothetical protein L4C36_10200 [Photobacterium japonica]|uniref:hypothetical protein n=1 Tax=Photobacterium japonica TaxID=2910235 RepID=UPI003D13592E